MMMMPVALAAALIVVSLDSKPPRPKPNLVLVSIRVTKPPDTFTAPDYRDRVDSANDLARWLGNLMAMPSVHKKIGFVQYDWHPDVIVEILGREADGDLRTVRASVIVGSTTIPMVGKSDDGAWRDAAEDLAKRLRAWLLDNHALILKQRSPQ